MRVVIGEDEALLRQGVVHVLESDGIEVLAAVETADELENEVRRLSPDLVITDIRMPPTHTDEGLLAALRIREAYPAMPVVVLSQYVQRRYAVELLAQRTGGVGYLLKQRIANVRSFTTDLRRVAAGGMALDPDVVSIMVTRASHLSGAVASLTPRQTDVLALMAQGRSNVRIAADLGLTDRAVVQHTSHIYDALALPLDADDHRRVLAVIRFLTEASATPADPGASRTDAGWPGPGK